MCALSYLKVSFKMERKKPRDRNRKKIKKRREKVTEKLKKQRKQKKKQTHEIKLVKKFVKKFRRIERKKEISGILHKTNTLKESHKLLQHKKYFSAREPKKYVITFMQYLKWVVKMAAVSCISTTYMQGAGGHGFGADRPARLCMVVLYF